MDVLSHVLGIPKIGGGGGVVPPVITTTSLPDGTVGVAYSQTIQATGTEPITFAVTSGNLPAGLSLNADTGAVTGTPAVGGTFNFTVTATNEAGSDDQEYSLEIAWTYATFLQSFVDAGTLPFWHRYNETSGTAVINHGSAGSTLNGTWTPGAGALGQTGQLGANEAYDFDGLNSQDTVAANSANDSNAWTWAFLINPKNAGEGSNSRFYSFDSGLNRLQFNAALTSLTCSRNLSTTPANSTTSSGLSTGAWQWLFVTYDHAGDKRIRLYRGVSGVVTEYSYNSQTAGVGDLVSLSSATLIIGNNSLASATIDALLDEALRFNVVLSTAQMEEIVKLSGMLPL